VKTIPLGRKAMATVLLDFHGAVLKYSTIWKKEKPSQKILYSIIGLID